MKPLAWILELFPRSFAKRFGNEWLSVAEDVLAQARTQGRWALTVACVKLVMDAARQAPVAHARVLRASIVGEQPILAGVGGGQRALLLAKHWGVRPMRILGRGLIRYAWAMVAGGLVAGLLHAWLEQRAWKEERRIDPSQMLQEGTFLDNPQALILIVAVPLVLLMGVAVWPKLMAEMRKLTIKQGFDSTFAFALGFYLVLTSILLGQLREVSTEVNAPFAMFSLISQTPTARPSSDRPEEWTAAQKEWFGPAHPAKETLLPEKHAQWCAIRQAQLDSWQKSIMASHSSGTAIALLLWQGLRTSQYTQGCMDEATWVRGHDAAAFAVREGPGLFQRTWEPLAFIHPIADRLVVAHHIAWPQLVMSPEKYCTATAEVMLGPGQLIDYAKLVSVCNPSDGIADLPEKSLLPRWSWLAEIRHNNEGAKPMTEFQRKTIRQRLENTRAQWQVDWVPSEP